MNRFYRLSLATLMSLLSWMSVFGQGIVVEEYYTTDLEAQIDHALAPLSMIPVTSGILLNRTLPLFPTELIGGSTSADSVQMDVGILDATYRSIYAARIPGFTGLASPESAYAGALSQHNNSGTVPIVLAALEFHRFVDDPIGTGLLDTISGQLHHATNTNPADAYTTGRVFASGLYRYIMDQQVTFTLPVANLIGNVPVNQSSIEIDADDGSGFRTLNPGSTLVVSYTGVGDRVIKIRFADTTGTEVVHYHRIRVVNTGVGNIRDDRSGLRGGTLTFDCPPDCICDDITGDDGKATIRYSIWLSCLNEDGTRSTDISKLKRPLIILDGIDLTWTENSFDMNTLLSGDARGLEYQDSLIFNNQSLGQILDANDYDIIFLDYHDHHTRIEYNAAAFQAVLRHINAVKQANGSTFKNIVMGISMGGVVGRYGLREMEINGEDHDVETYITFDSPMQGANVPLMGQAALTHVLSIAGSFIDPLSILDFLGLNFAETALNGIESVNGFYLVLNSIAARQMLKYHINDVLGTDHYTFYNKLHNEMGPLQNCKTVGISNGSGNGSAGGGEMGAGNLAFGVEYSNFNSKWLGTSIVIDIKGFTAPGSGSDNLIYQGFVKIKLLSGLVEYNNNKRVYGPPNMKSIDTCPGGTIGILAAGEDVRNITLPEIVTLNAENFCFIPTVSALDVQGIGSDLIHPNLLSSDFSSTTYDEIITQQGTLSVPSLRNGTAIVNNNGHVIMTFDNISLLLNTAKVEGDPLTNPVSSRIYNFGSGAGSTGTPFRPTTTPDYFRRNTHITGSGKVWINRDDRIAYTDVTENVYNSTGSHFDVTMGRDICADAAREVTVSGGGQLSIGQWSSGNTGRLILTENTKLTIGSGGELNIDDRSGLIVKAGATVELEAGANVRVFGDGYIHIEEGGTLKIHGGTNIWLEKVMFTNMTYESQHVGSVIRLEGNLHATNGVVNIIGDGFIWIRAGNSFTTGTGSLSWQSNDKQFTSYRVDAPVTLQGINFGTYQAKVMVNKKIEIKDGSSVDFDNSAFHTYPIYLLDSDHNANQLLKEYNRYVILNNNVQNINITRCSFDDVPVHSRGFSSQTVEGVISETVVKAMNFVCEEGDKVLFSYTTISTKATVFQSGPRTSKVGVSSKQVFESNYKGCTFDGFNHLNSREENPYPEVVFIAIRHEKSPYLFLFNTTIRDCDKGVYAPDAFNVVMDQSEIKDCHTGIEMTGTANVGLVKMICSALLGNVYGINGTDITLAIDGKINSQTKNGTILPNRFTNLQLHFRICYQYKEPELDIPASHNVWTNSEKYQIGFCPNYYVSNLIQLPYGRSECLTANVAQCEDSAPVFPMIGDGLTGADYEGLCVSTNTCKGDPIMESYWRGYTCYYNDDLASAIEHLTPLAKDFYTDKLGLEPILCKAILDEANAFVGGLSAYNHEEEPVTLDIISVCARDTSGHPESYLSVIVPPFIGSGYTTHWFVSNGGIIVPTESDTVIMTNGIGKYKVIIAGGGCIYNRTFDYKYHSIPCPVSCIDEYVDLVQDTSICGFTSSLYNRIMDEDIELPEGASVILQEYRDSIWNNADFTYQSGNIIPQNNGVYRLVLTHDTCMQVSNIHTISCITALSCPVITQVESEVDSIWSYHFSVSSNTNQTLMLVIRTWQTDTTLLQFTDTVLYHITASTDTLSYEDLPEEYSCYNYGDIRVVCMDCDTICPPMYISWACIPKSSGDESYSASKAKVMYYPNPFTGSLYFDYTSDISEAMTLTAYNNTGQPVFKEQLSLQIGSNMILLEGFEQLPPGIYTIRLLSGTGIYVAKVIKIQ